MVAGGGGGQPRYNTVCGTGGGLSGTNGNGVSGNYSRGGTQTTGAGFGIGGNGPSSNTGKGGGGSGYYGGFGGGTSGYYNAGGGGSGFVSGMEGCNAIISELDRTPSNQPNHYSGLIFTDSYMENGVNNGHGSFIIKVLTSLNKFLFEDNNTLKYYNPTLESWEVVPS